MKKNILLLSLASLSALAGNSNMGSSGMKIPNEGLYALKNDKDERSCDKMFKIKHMCGGFLILNEGALNSEDSGDNVFEQFCNLSQPAQKSNKYRNVDMGHITTTAKQETNVKFAIRNDGALEKTVNTKLKFPRFPGAASVRYTQVAAVKISGPDITLTNSLFESGAWYPRHKCLY